MSTLPAVSLIIPVHNGAPTLGRCLGSVFDGEPEQVIVVDDGSTDDTAAIAARFPCELITLPQNCGTAAARNIGARRARGEILFFLDGDIVMERDTLTRIAQTFADQETLGALFGSYQIDTAPQNFFSVYKNLLHHFTHQHASPDAVTFCGGYGAVRRDIFFALGGFDESYHALEDIEFGYRLFRAGYRTQLLRDLQFTHLKTYTLGSLLRSDVRNRAIPWTRLMLEKKIFRNDLNTRANNVVSVALAFGIVTAPLWVWVTPSSALVLGVLVCALLILNFDFLRFAARARGIRFGIGAALMTWFYYVYSGIGLFVGLGSFLWQKFSARA